MNEPSKICIKHVKYKLNGKQYIGTGSLARCQVVNNGLLVRWRNPLCEESIRGTTYAASWAVTRRIPGALSSLERETPYLLKRKYRDNGNSGSTWVYTFIVVVISSIYSLISSLILSLWNSRSTFLSFSSIIVRILSAIKCPDNFDCP